MEKRTESFSLAGSFFDDRGAYKFESVHAEAKAYDYIVPDADIRYLTTEDIQNMSPQVLCYAKNEIYARHGRMFQSQELTDYFEEQLWYYGCISPSEFANAVLNVYETANIKLLQERENTVQSGGYVLDQPGYEFSGIYDYIYGNNNYIVEDDYYVFPDSDTRYLSIEDTDGMTAQEICYGKNEIYARHGRQFISQELTEYFGTRTWYFGNIAPSAFSPSVFNSYENANVKLLSDVESLLTNGADISLISRVMTSMQWGFPHFITMRTAWKTILSSLTATPGISPTRK